MATPPRRCTGGGSGSPLRARTPRPAPSSPRRSPGSRHAGHATYVHADGDVMVGRLDCDQDYLADMLAAMVDEPGTLTVAFNIAMDHDRPYTTCGASGAWRTEARAGMIDRVRLRDACPLPNRLDGDHLALPWHRALDRAVALGAGRSLRGGDLRTFYVHPPNARKRDAEQWLAVLDRIEHGVVPRIQMGQVDWTGRLAEWMGPARREPFVFVVSGRNVPPGRFRRCVESMARQQRECWGGGALRRRVGGEDWRALRDCPRLARGAVHGGAQPAPPRGCWPTW